MNVYIVPGSPANFEATIRRPVSTRELERHISSNDVNKLIAASGGDSKIHCWAFKKGRQSLFSQMKPGDRVLFRVNKTDQIQYIGEVCFKVHSASLGGDLWPDQATDPWEFIYFLKNLEETVIDFSIFKSRLQFNPKFHLLGVITLNQDKWSIIRREFGSFDDFLNALSTPGAPTPKGSETIIRRAPDSDVVKPEPPRTCEPILGNEKTLLKKLVQLDDQIDELRKDPDHKERAHESLVESFLEILGYSCFTDIKHRQGRIDISIQSNGKTHVVVEVKKDWKLSRNDMNVVRQAFNYALESGSQYVIISNGDYYAMWDQEKGRSYDEMFLGEFRVSELPPSQMAIQLFHLLQKASW